MKLWLRKQWNALVSHVVVVVVVAVAVVVGGAIWRFHSNHVPVRGWMVVLLIALLIGLVIGLLLGRIVTTLYDRSGFHRIPGAVEMAIAEAHQTQHKSRSVKGEAPAGHKHELTAEAKHDTAAEAEPASQPAGEPESPSGQT